MNLNKLYQNLWFGWIGPTFMKLSVMNISKKEFECYSLSEVLNDVPRLPAELSWVKESKVESVE